MTPLSEDELLDIIAAFTAGTDQLEAEMAEKLGVPRVTWDACFLVSPDVGMRLTREGVRPPHVHISWMLPERSVYAIDRPAFHGR